MVAAARPQALTTRSSDDGNFTSRSVAAPLTRGVNGLPEVPLVEDADFYRALQRGGHARPLAGVIETSPRRYEEIGPYRTTAMYVLILALYVAPVPVPLLARIHSRFVSGRRCNREFHPLYEHSCQA